MRSLHFDRAGTTLTALLRGRRRNAAGDVPGAMADAESWRPVVDHIHLPNPVIVVNRRGRTPSGPLGPYYSVRTDVDDRNQIIDELATDVHLFGWSYGGLIAVEAATERYDLRSLSLYEPVAAHRRAGSPRARARAGPARQAHHRRRRALTFR